MNTKTLARHRRQLEALRGRVGADARAVARQALGPSGGQDGGDLSNAPFHLADEGTEEFLHDMSAALAENETYLLGEIGDALVRIDAGTFGQCESCGKAIVAERIEAMPYARHCIACADAQQTGLNVNLNTGRPQSPADTYAPEGGMQENWRPGRSDATGSGRRSDVANDEHAVGEPGGGSAIGGLAGTNIDGGDPTISALQEAAGSGEFDVEEARDDPAETPRSGRAGGAVGGTPARKRAK